MSKPYPLKEQTQTEKLEKALKDLSIETTAYEGTPCRMRLSKNDIKLIKQICKEEGLKFIKSNCINCPEKKEDDWGLICMTYCLDPLQFEEIEVK